MQNMQKIARHSGILESNLGFKGDPGSILVSEQYIAFDSRNRNKCNLCFYT